MNDGPLFVTGAGVRLVHDEEYSRSARDLIVESRHFCLCSVFIVDTDPFEEASLKVDALLLALTSAAWRGVDARLLIGGSRDTRPIIDSTVAALERARSLGIPARLLAAQQGPSEHSKFIASDAGVLLGSHNWSPGALSGQIQDSVLINNPALEAYLAERFVHRWLTASEGQFDVQD